MGKSSKSQAQLKLFLGSTLCKESAMDDSSGHLVHHCSPQLAFHPILEVIIAETSLLELLLHRRAALYSLLDISLERIVWWHVCVGTPWFCSRLSTCSSHGHKRLGVTSRLVPGLRRCPSTCIHWNGLCCSATSHRGKPADLDIYKHPFYRLAPKDWIYRFTRFWFPLKTLGGSMNVLPFFFGGFWKLDSQAYCSWPTSFPPSCCKTRWSLPSGKMTATATGVLRHHC